MNGEKPSKTAMTGPSPAHASRSAVLRLLVIPSAVYTVWVVATFLLEGTVSLFQHPDAMGIFLYTSMACILSGMVIPFLWIRGSFMTGAVNMFQIGFRAVRRTVMACALTTLTGYMSVVLFSPFGTDRIAFAEMFLILLPTAIASVMVCWVLVGTHVQAFVRSGGTLISIIAGSLVTAGLFCLTSLAHSPAVRVQPALAGFLVLGVSAAVFFFAVRDVYAGSIFAAVGLTFVMADRTGVENTHAMMPPVYGSALLAVIALVGIHLYLSRNFMTVRLQGK